MEEYEDLYALLGIDRKASARVIDRAYRKLSRRCHPEVNPGDEKARTCYEAIRRAYVILADSHLREEYDRMGMKEFFRLHPRRESGSAELLESDFWSEIVREGFIGEILGLGKQPPAPIYPDRGEEIVHFMNLNLLEVAKGKETDIRISRRISCPECRGAGTATSSGPERCAVCLGSGRTARRQGSFSGNRLCVSCMGLGYLIRRSCPACGGRGVVEREETIRLKIPPGIFTGSEIRLKGRGHVGTHGSPAGDLVVIAKIEEDRRFHRKGDNIYSALPMMVWEAALGAEMLIPTLYGKVPLALPPGTQNGQRFRLPGKGVPNLKTGRRGDQVVEVQVIIPEPKDEASRKAYRKLAEVFTVNTGAG